MIFLSIQQHSFPSKEEKSQFPSQKITFSFPAGCAVISPKGARNSLFAILSRICSNIVYAEICANVVEIA